MARDICRTLCLEGELVADTPVSIGGADSAGPTDIALAMDGMGRHCLPGTSIAGSLRAWQRAARTDRVWGFTESDLDGHASYLSIDDAPVLADARPELWHGVGIDRRTGGASEGIKYDRQVLPRGTRFAFRIQREVAEAGELEAARAAMGRMMRALAGGEVSFGASQSRGMGRLHLENAKGHETDWSSRPGILAWMSGDLPDATALWREAAQGSPEATGTRCASIEIHWQPRGPLMSKAARDGLAVDALPFVSRIEDGRHAMALPGSSIKGALRQHAERIVRTVLHNGDEPLPEAHQEQLEVPLVSDLFGSAGSRSIATGAAGGSRGLLAVDTCYAHLALNGNEWDSLDASRESWRDSPHPIARADHVSIDRWTGAAADSALFNAAEPDASVQWQPIRMHFDLQRRGEQGTKAALALLWLVLRDFAAGKVPLGHGVNRGYGDLAVSRILVRGFGPLGIEDADLSVHEGTLASHPALSLLKDAWTRWQAERNTTP